MTPAWILINFLIRVVLPCAIISLMCGFVGYTFPNAIVVVTMLSIVAGFVTGMVAMLLYMEWYDSHA